MAVPRASEPTSLPLPGGALGSIMGHRRSAVGRLVAFACPPFTGARRGTATPACPASESEEKQKAALAAVSTSYDTLGSELNENARIWHFFRTAITAYDQSITVHEWNETLDVLLVFAALFLGAITSFVTQAYPMLSGTNTGGPPPHLFIVAIGLFFCSLIVSLAVSLFCIMAKQWLQEYLRRLTEPTKSARYWARRRWIYERGLKDWGIAFLCTDGLPLMLHLALFLFAIGLVLLLSTLHRSIAWLVGAITIVLALVYTGCTFAPILWFNAPTATPLLRRQSWRNDADNGGPRPHFVLTRSAVRSLFTKSWEDMEREYVESPELDVELSTMRWLLTVSRSESALEVAFSAVSALDKTSPALQFVRETEIGIADAFQTMHSEKLRALDIMRVIRSELHLRPGDWKRPRLGLDIPHDMLKRLAEAESADARVLHAVMQKVVDFKRIAERAREWREMESPSLLSTIRLLLRSKNLDARAVFYLMLPLHARELREMRGDFVALALEQKMRAESQRKRLLMSGSSVPEADDGDMRNPSAQAHSPPTQTHSPGGNQSCASPAAWTLSSGQHPERDAAAALVSLVEITAKFACSYYEISLAAHLAVRIVAPIKEGLPAVISPIPWQDPLDKVQPRTSEIFSYFRSRDPVLGWCRTQARLLHAIISEWCLLSPPKSDSPGYPPKRQSRVPLGRRAAFILESLLSAHESPECSSVVRATITSMLLITFLDTTKSLESALTADAPERSLSVLWDSENSRPGKKPARSPTQPIQPATEAWRDIHRLQLPHSTLLRLAVTISGALCSAQRRNNRLRHTNFVTVFLSADCLGNLLADSSRVERIVPSKAYVHLAQHCIELQTDWCSAMGGTNGATGSATSKLAIDSAVLAGWISAMVKSRKRHALKGIGVRSDQVDPWLVKRLRLRHAIRCFFANKLEKAVAQTRCTLDSCDYLAPPGTSATTSIRDIPTPS